MVSYLILVSHDTKRKKLNSSLTQSTLTHNIQRLSLGSLDDHVEDVADFIN